MDEKVTSFGVDAIAGRTGAWRVALYPDYMELASADESEFYELSRDEVEDLVRLRERGPGAPLLTVKLSKQIAFKLQPESSLEFLAWQGPPTQRRLIAALRRRLRFGLPIAVLYLLSSAPVAGNPDAGVEAIAFDSVSAALGASLLVLLALVKIAPRRILFLFDAMWFSALALSIGSDVARGDSTWWLVLIPVLLYCAAGGLVHYQRFAVPVGHQTAE
jgi:hypothetical protein